MVDQQKRRLMGVAVATAATSLAGVSGVHARDDVMREADIKKTLRFLSSVSNLQILAGGYCALSSLALHIALVRWPEKVDRAKLARFCPSRVLWPLSDVSNLQEVHNVLANKKRAKSIEEQMMQRIPKVVYFLEKELSDRKLSYKTTIFSHTSEPIIHVERILLAYSITVAKARNRNIVANGICDEFPFDIICEILG